MRSVLFSATRSCLISFLTAGLLSLPVTAAPSPYVGVIVSSSSALLSGVNATQGADVYVGDTLVTQPDGALRLATGSSQMSLLASTKATMERDGGTVRAAVNSGTVAFSTVPGQMEVETPLGVVQGVGNGRTFGQVSVISPKEIIVRAVGGTLTLNTDGDLRTVVEGTAYRFVDESAAEPQAPQGYSSAPKSVHRHKKRKIGAFIIIGGGALAGYFIWHEVTESPTTPSGTPAP